MSGVADQLAIQDALRAWVVTAIANTPAAGRVVFAHQGQLRPERPYVQVHPMSVATRGRDDRLPFDANGVRHVTGPRVVAVEIQTFWAADDNTGDAVGLAEQVKAALYLETVTDALRTSQAKLSFLQADTVQHLVIELEAELEERGIFEARFAYGSDQTETVGWIEDIELHVQLESPPGGAVIDETYWVPDSPA